MRITSTYVENTKYYHQHQDHGRDHLHIRGEYFKNLLLMTLATGSPPHTWRILLQIGVLTMLIRITSTYVENTEEITPNDLKFEDHLHIRGEYLKPSTQAFLNLGSPPHTWRIPPYDRPMDVNIRITSTYVENTVNKSLYSAK